MYIIKETADRRVTLLVTTIASFLVPYMGSSVNIALPSIGREFSLSAISLSWVAASFILAAAASLLPLGRIADLYGRKRIFVWGILLYVFSSLLSGASPSVGVLIVSRVLQGVGGAMIFSTAIAILTSVFPAGERGRVLGINVASVYLGLSLGPFLGGFLTQHFGWRGIFLASVPLGLIIIALVSLKLKGEWAEAREEKFDVAGSIVYSLALVAIMYGLSLLPGPSGAWIILMGALGLLAFLKWEGKVEHPILDLNLFRRSAVFTFSNLAALINYSATFAVGFLLSLYLQYVKGLSPQHAGLVLIFQPLTQTIFSPLAGRLSDRIEPRIVASLGMVSTAGGLILFTLLTADTGMGFIIFTQILLGLGFAFFSSPNTNAIMSSVDQRRYGVASAVLGTMRLTGQMLSMAIAMIIFAGKMGEAPLASGNSLLFLGSAREAFLIFACLCLVGTFASLARGRLH
jgi:EmrB/QacA subfamily drug resistance transporter